MKAYFDIQHGSTPLGRLVMELYDDSVPKTVRNFTTLIERGSYRDCLFHRIIPGFMAQGGDFENGDGTGGSSIYGKTFADEDLRLTHERRGQLSMANAGPHTNGSQFFICFRPTPHLNGKHVVFGHVEEDSLAVVDALEQVATSRTNDRPLQPVLISDCGVIHDQPEPQKGPQADSTKETHSKETTVEKTVADDDEIDLEEEEKEEADEEDGVPLTKAQQMKQRLRKLKQKMNQARQLNKQAVKEEGQRVGKPVRHNRPPKTKNTQEHAVVRQSAADALQKAEKTASRAEMKRYSVNDYHNPEGQFRSYERNLISVKRSREAAGDAYANQAAGTYNPIDAALNNGSQESERQGARRLAQEMHRRYEKRQKRNAAKIAKDLMDDDADVNHINERNKRFNQKINRTYDKATAEIRENLERGSRL